MSELPTSKSLRDKLAAVRRKQVATAVVSGLALTFVAIVVILAADMTLDWWLELSRPARAVLLLLDITALALLYFRNVVRPMTQQPDDEDIALWIEQQAPELRSRFISTVQLQQRQGDAQAPDLVRALVAETEKIAAPVDFAVAVPTAPMWRMCGVALIACLAGMLAFAAAKPGSAIFLQRVFLSSLPVPRQTQVFCLTGNKTIARGDSLELEARATGVIPHTGRAWLKRASGESQTVTLIPDTNTHFRETLDNVQDSFTYVIQLNDGVSKPYRIDVQPRPVIASLSCEQQFPEYTHQSAITRRPNDLNLLAGSHLVLKAIATKPIQSATVWLEGLNEQVAMTVDPQTRTNLSATIPIPTNALTGFLIRLSDSAGLRSKDETTYRVDIVLDTPPEVRMTFPRRREELVTTNADMLIGFEASDDFGIQQVRLHKKIGESETATDLDLQEQQPRALKRRYEWQLAELNPHPREGAVIEYWLEVRDANTVTGPGVSFSEHFFARVVSEPEKRADLLSRFDQTLQVIGAVSKDQENLNKSLGELIQEKQSTP